MTSAPVPAVSEGPRTIRKAVTTLAIAAQTESLTRTARLAYNVMIFIAQNTSPDEDGGFSAPMAEVVDGFESSTRNSTRVQAYIEQMCTTLVRWFPLSRTDEPQASFDGMDSPETPVTPMLPEGRVFTLMSEARFNRVGGQQWVTWYFPPTLRDMILDPARWAQIDIKEMSQLSHYASVALYEICARYGDSPGGLSNKASPEFWTQVLRPDPETKPRLWRKFKSETLKPTIAEINQRTSLQIEMIEEKRGKTVVSVQFRVRRQRHAERPKPVELSLVERALALKIKERDLDQIVDEYGEEHVQTVLSAMERRHRVQAIKHPVAYLRTSLRKGSDELPFDEPAASEPSKAEELLAPAPPVLAADVPGKGLTLRQREINDALDMLPPQEIERLALLARSSVAAKGLLTPSMEKRFSSRNYKAPMIWEYIRGAYAEERFGPNWRLDK